MDLYHLRQGLHVIASSWDYHGGAESRASVRGNSIRFVTEVDIVGMRVPLTQKSRFRVLAGSLLDKRYLLNLPEIPHQIPKRKASKSLQENRQEKAPKITKKNEQEQHIQALRNHTESSIHHIEVHTRSSLPPNHPSLSQDLTIKLSS
jgi:hypothetical protein